MNRKRRTARMAAALAAALLLSVTISAAAEPGSAKDPLVTLSYLNDTYLNTIMEKVDARIRQRNADLLGQLGQSGGTSSGSSSSANFVLVTLSGGQTLTGSVGCEVLLRVGSATCVASSAPGLIDETTGTTLSGGSALVQNHLYMMTVENRGVRAGTATVKLLVRGGYTVS